MPERFLLQILRDMTKQGILHSTRGGGGGFMLGRRPEEISLLDMIEAVDGPINAALPGKGAFPEESAERLQEALKGITEQVRGELAAIRLCDLMTGPRGSVASEDVSRFPLLIDEPHDPPRMTGLAVKASEAGSL
jgi:Rrf2 family protein